MIIARPERLLAGLAAAGGVLAWAAYARAETINDRGYYFDFIEIDKNGQKNNTPSTPPMRTTSPSEYWFSSTTKIPASQSRISVWAPKPTARPNAPENTVSAVRST